MTSTLLGTRLNGRYRLDARIAAGGMSTVYRATDETLERQVAIKLMNREVSADSDQLERFRREARAVAQLNHPHVVGVIDAGEDAGRPYIVFEYVEGETLKERIRRHGRLEISEAIAYAIEIARALGGAHARHIVHRDVKPQNVLIDEEGSAKVTDFGIARTLEEDGLTADGRVLGTTDYVAPEQALGHEVTGQSDLYSLGIVLYEMLTGEVPFKGENQVAVAMKHVRDALPDIQAKRPEVSAALAAVLDRATAKRAEDRYADDAELIADLEDVLGIETARAGSATGEVTAVLRTLPTKAKRRLPLRLRRPALALVLLLSTVAVAAGLATWLATRAHHGTGQLAQPPPKAAPHQILLCDTCAHAFSPLGTTPQNPNMAGYAIDNNPVDEWPTVNYYDHVLLEKGIGIYVDAAPRTPVSDIRMLTTTPGFNAQFYASDATPSPTAWPGSWVQVGSQNNVQNNQTIPLNTSGTPHRYWLVWITKLPPGGEYVGLKLALYK
ncbi:MAG: eukaryotic-like serine/threonine-protein kinase [Solirubrobacteraceae bacterium]|nr:eukaryotic-like serine/threonine-protein kinase [Solirubrobacteraceae bacterium]